MSLSPPAASPLAARWTATLRRFWRFGLVGVVGFLVDAGLLQVAVFGFGLNRFWGRILSYGVAILVTWLLNKVFTFQGAGTHGRLVEIGRYTAVQVSGLVLNFALYWAAILASPFLRQHLFLAVAIGSAGAMFFNFAAASRFVFRGAPPDARSRDVPEDDAAG